MFLGCLGWAAVMLFFVSPDSFTHDMYYRWDSAWFFTCGKAWAEGLRPYVDFADSKGPLLWMIHAVAYWLSPYNYLGLFALSIGLYGVVFYLDYQIAYLFLKDKGLSWLVVMLLPLAYFNPWYHFEISAEDWCQPVISWTVYRLLKLLYTKDCRSQELLLTGWVLGFSLMWTLLIKFSLTVMLGVTACYGLWFLIRERIQLVKPLLGFVAGLLTLALPIGGYLLLTGTFAPFVQEYFVNTLQTVSSQSPLADYMHEWFRTLADAYYATLFGFSLLGGCLLGRRLGKDRLFLVIAFLGFYALGIHHNYHRHYMNCCLFFLIPFIIYMVDSYRERLLNTSPKCRRLMAGAVLLLVVVVNWTYTQGFIVPNLFFHHHADRQHYYTVGYYMSQVEKPRLLYYRYAERGFGTPVGALPSSKYWSTQTNPTREMLAGQDADIATGRADFVITYSKAEYDSLLTSSGYQRLYEFAPLALYSKHRVQAPPASFRVSSMDVLLKRNVFRKD